ncbi:hypothetical protein KQI19_14765 [Enterococcus gallinarum]|uniref:hypothetical protein n=1 Tax=Enterococcus gallinarum TaxID=1353 RepID=UPI001C10CB14|nr:hypothetical protein [Enterococcus gallinarum]MBU5359367.1 hypothetical protein [Enterococcus gallinarum]MCC2754173.1 hypothetical protein [Enterococcus gallinarum]
MLNKIKAICVCAAIILGIGTIGNTVAIASEVNTNTNENEYVDEEGTYGVLLEYLSDEVIAEITSITFQDLMNLAIEKGYDPEDIWTKEEIEMNTRSVMLRRGVNKMIVMSNDLKYLYLDSSYSKAALALGVGALSSLFSPIAGVFASTAAAFLIDKAGSVDLNKGVIIRFSRNKAHLLVPTAIWTQDS